jgi:hypothetical protein
VVFGSQENMNGYGVDSSHLEVHLRPWLLDSFARTWLLSFIGTDGITQLVDNSAFINVKYFHSVALGRWFDLDVHSRSHQCSQWQDLASEFLSYLDFILERVAGENS